MPRSSKPVLLMEGAVDWIAAQPPAIQTVMIASVLGGALIGLGAASLLWNNSEEDNE